MSDEAEKPTLSPMSDMKAKLREKLMAKQRERENAEAEERAARQRATDAYYQNLKETSGAEGGAEISALSSARLGPRAETGGIALPTTWWGAELQALADGMPQEDVAALKERMERISTASDNNQIIEASQRLQQLFKDKPALTSLLNPIIMRAYVLKMQTVRQMTFTSAKAKAGARVANAKAEASLAILMSGLDD